MILINLLTGILLLLAGRRLFWVSVACIGFIAAFRYTQTAVIPGPEWIIWIIPLVVGLLGALVAFVYQKIAVILIGFMAGEMVVLDLIHLAGFHEGGFAWIVLIAGGLVGAIAMLIVFDWALIFLSSLAGSTVIVPFLGLNSESSNIAFIGLAVLGIIVQSLFFLKNRNRSV